MPEQTHSRFQFQHRPVPAEDGMADTVREGIDLAGRLALFGLALYLLLSDNLLVTWGYPYNVPGGSFAFKIHPGTYLIAIAAAVTLGTIYVGRSRLRLDGKRIAVGIYLLVSIASLGYSMVRFGSGGSGFMIDTLIAPAMLAFTLLHHPPHVARRAFNLVLIILAVNAIIGVIEAATQARLVPYLAGDQPIIEEFFRSTALGGHPLSNALRTSVILFACMALPKNRAIYWLIPLFILALLAFGSRAALVLSLALLALMAVWKLVVGLFTRVLERHFVMAMVGLTIVAVGVVVGVAIWLDLGERILNSFYWDRSAESRLLAFRVFEFTNPSELLLGVGPEGIDTILTTLKTMTTLTDIENPWILLILQNGLVPFIFLAGSLLVMIALLVAREPLPIKLAAAIFLLLVSSNNSLATKTQNLALLMPILIGGAAAASARTRPSRAAATVETVIEGGPPVGPRSAFNMRMPVNAPDTW